MKDNRILCCCLDCDIVVLDRDADTAPTPIPAPVPEATPTHNTSAVTAAYTFAATATTAQQCEPTMSGAMKFTHPVGTHDDQLWALVLAV
jgi:hypothetical protein